MDPGIFPSLRIRLVHLDSDDFCFAPLMLSSNMGPCCFSRVPGPVAVSSTAREGPILPQSYLFVSMQCSR
jgi:hypothetical protein